MHNAPHPMGAGHNNATHCNNDTGSTARFHDNVANSVPQCQTLLNSAAATDDEGGMYW